MEGRNNCRLIQWDNDFDDDDDNDDYVDEDKTDGGDDGGNDNYDDGDESDDCDDSDEDDKDTPGLPDALAQEAINMHSASLQSQVYCIYTNLLLFVLDIFVFVSQIFLPRPEQRSTPTT